MKYFISAFLALFPLITLAERPHTFGDLVYVFLRIINNALIPAIFALTFLVIVWGVVKAWIISAGDEKEREKGKSLVIAGLIALVVMIGIWGILAILQSGLFG
jgi:hypothetical protein